jgi:hypothetical protein
MALCKSCVLKWLPDALRTGRMKWETIHAHLKRILINAGYDKNGNLVRK